jgi:signal transduction histidine kinase
MASEAGASIGEELIDIPVATLVEDALSRVPKRDNVDIAYEDAIETRTVRLAPRGLARAISCLVENGVAASATDARVILRVSATEEAVQFAVEDAGPGIPPDLLDRVKDPFFTTKPTGKGLGLGLFFAETVISEMGGRLEIFNGGGGGGACALATVPHLLNPSKWKEISP